MRLLLVTNLYPNPAQPHRAPFNRQQFAALAQQHEVRIIAPIAWVDQLRGTRHQRTILRDGLHVEHPRYYYLPKILRSWHGHCFLRSIRPAFARALEEFKPQAVIASWAYPDAWAAVKLAKAANLPVVAKVHGSDVLLHRRRQTIDALTTADAVIAVSRQLAGKCSDMGVASDRLHVVYNGIDADLFHPGPSKLPSLPDPLILFVGNLVPVKCLPVLIDACRLLRDRKIKFQCRLIGQGPLQSVLWRHIDHAGLSGQVQLVGPRPLEELADWYRAAAVLALPSRSEGIPNVILEAQACGTRVVASRVGGIPEILDDDSLVPPHNAPALAAALERALSLPRNSPSKTRSWADSAAQLASVVSQTIQQNHRAAA